MRKITSESIDAFYQRSNYKKSNMEVEHNQGTGLTTLYLHGNAIAHLNRDGLLFIRSAGWTSNTTKERLNGLQGVTVQQKAFTWYLNGKEWTDHEEWTDLEKWNNTPAPITMDQIMYI